MNGASQAQFPKTTVDLLKYIAKKIPERLLKAIPLTVITAAVLWLLHTGLLVVANEGFNPETWLGRNLLNVKGRFISSTLLWTLVGFMIPIILSAIARRRNPATFFTAFFTMPFKVFEKNKSAGGKLLPAACFTTAVLLFLNGFLSGMTTALAGGIFMSSVASFVTGGGGIFVQVIRMIVNDIQMFLLKKRKFSFDDDSVYVILGVSGTVMLIFGILRAIIDQPSNYQNIFVIILLNILNWSWAVFAILGFVAFAINNSNKAAVKSFMLLISITGLAFIFSDLLSIRVLADDGGWVESGGNLIGWITSEGALQATAMGLPPAVGGVVGSYIGSIMGSLMGQFGGVAGGGVPYSGDSGGDSGYGGDQGTDGSQSGDGEYSPENQIETKPDGTIIITKPDGSKEGYSPDGTTAQMTPDGTTTYTSPDGTVTIEHPDGSAEQTNPDGSKTTLSTDGTETTYNTDGSVTTHTPDGGVTQQNTDGSVTTLNKDGSQTVANTDGTKTTLHTDGSMTLTDADGTAKTYDKDNHLVSKTLPNGAMGTYDSNGNLNGGKMADGTPITVSPDGSMTITKDGVTMTVAADGSVSGGGTMGDGTHLTINKDGSMVAKLPNGDSATLNSDGDLVGANITMDDGRKIDIDGNTGVTTISNEKTGEHATINPDGSATYTGPDGKATIGTDGSLSESYNDGTQTNLGPDGHVTVKQPDGTTWNANPDGTGTATQPDGTVWTANKDGTTDIAKTDGTKIHVGTDKTIHITHPDGKTEIVPPDTKGGK